MRINCLKAIRLTLFVIGLAAAVDTGSAQTPVQLITTNTPWRYNKTGDNLGTAWTNRTYNDLVAGWEGPGLPLFGYETDEAQYNAIGVFFNTRFPDPVTVTPYVTNYYFRAHFSMPNTSPGILAATTLVCSNWLDDGSVVYLNGAELARPNMPAGTIVATTFSTVAAEP